MNRDKLKYLALLPMAAGHFCSYLSCGALPPDAPWAVFLLTHLALFAPPIFFSFIAEGFRYTRDRKKYALRLLAFALITQIPYCLASYGTLLTIELFRCWNIIMTLFLGLVGLMIWEQKWKLPVRILLLVLLNALTVAIRSEWLLTGIPLILGFHIFREKPKTRFFWFCGWFLLMEGCVLWLSAFAPFAWLSAGIEFVAALFAYWVITRCYNGEKGKHPRFTKWFFYLFYPAHMVMIYAIKLVLH